MLREACHDRHYLLSVVGDELLHQRRLRRLAHWAVRWAAMSRGGEVGLLGGGTLINLSDMWLNAYKLVCKRTASLVPVFGTGVASPEFWSRFQPGWTDRRREWVSLLKDLPVVGVRGPISKALLEDAGARNVVISGDPAVRLHIPLAQTGQPARTDRPLRIGINCGYSPCPIWGNLVSLHEALAGVAHELCRLGYQVELLAVWPEDIRWCEQVARESRMPQMNVAPLVASPKSFLQKVESLDLLVALKLHAAVLSAAVNVPFVLLEYQPKCLDFASSLGWQRFAVRTSDVTSRRVLDVLYPMLGELPLLKAQLCSAMCKLSAQFDQYCLMIEPLLIQAQERHWSGRCP